jgi:vacuolar-type H+-ATPase subunit H
VANESRSGWTVDTWVLHTEALRVADARFHAERDRRYTEVKNAEEKALRIKEQADRDALDLARQIQSYKDEKANELREQINSERGLYASKHDLVQAVEKMEAISKPLADYVAQDRGRGAGTTASWQMLVAVIGLVATLMSIAAVGVAVVLYLNRQAAPIYTPAPTGTQIPGPPLPNRP